MEELIKQAFLHVDLIGQHVQDGHYDLIGPDGQSMYFAFSVLLLFLRLTCIQQLSSLNSGNM